MRKFLAVGVVAVLAAAVVVAVVAATRSAPEQQSAIVKACAEVILRGLPLIANERFDRFQGKVDEVHARCRGGATAVVRLHTPWVDWTNYWATGDTTSKSDRPDTGSHIFDRNKRGIDGALIDLEY